MRDRRAPPVDTGHARAAASDQKEHERIHQRQLALVGGREKGDVEGEFPVVRDGGHADGSGKQIVDAGDSSTCSPDQGYPGEVLMKEGSGSEQKLRREITIAGHELNPGQIAVTNADDLPARRVAGIGRIRPKKLALIKA
ncbi:MAG: hypothetical protein WBR56_21800 [Sedimenticolaceae bacterium]